MMKEENTMAAFVGMIVIFIWIGGIIASLINIYRAYDSDSLRDLIVWGIILLLFARGGK